MTRWYDDDCRAGNLDDLTPFSLLFTSSSPLPLSPTPPDMGEFLTDDLIWKYYLKGIITTQSQTQGHIITESLNIGASLVSCSSCQNRLRMTLKEENGFDPANDVECLKYLELLWSCVCRWSGEVGDCFPGSKHFIEAAFPCCWGRQDETNILLPLEISFS